MPSLEERAHAWRIRQLGEQYVGPLKDNLDRIRESATTILIPDPVNPHHYARLDPQPWRVIHAWGLDYFEGSVLKYLSRWRYKNGLEDLYKARQFLNELIAIEEGKHGTC
jgi:hypothetical protein